MRRPSASLLSALALAFASGAALAQSAETVRLQAGEWLVASDDGRPGCRVRLLAQKAVGGFVAAPAAACATALPALAKVVAWSFAEGVTLSDETRKPVLVFGEDETGLLKTRTGGPPAYLMLKAKPGVDRLPHASAVFGTWTMRRPGGASLCTVTFLNQPPKGGGEESYGLQLDPACDAAIRRLKLVSWRIEDDALMLYGSADGSLKFESSAAGFEKASEEGGRPLHLVKRP